MDGRMDVDGWVGVGWEGRCWMDGCKLDGWVDVGWVDGLQTGAWVLAQGALGCMFVCQKKWQ